MKIIKTYGWNRRDFHYDCTCEHCGAVETNRTGYDDDNYYRNVVPDIKCKKCGESSLSKPTEVPLSVTVPKYREDQVL